MKKLALLVVLAGMACPSCNKKKEAEELAPSTATTGTTAPVPKPDLFVKIDGTAFQCYECALSLFMNGSKYIQFGDQTMINSKDIFEFSFSTLPKTGTYNLEKNGGFAMTYIKAFTHYKISQGVITISKIDTAAGGTINELAATFSAKTDTTLPPEYPVFKLTEGEINFINK